MKRVEPKDYGKDHWSLLGFIETCCVDSIDDIGVLDIGHMRVRHGLGLGEKHSEIRSRPKWKDELGTRLSGYFKEGKTTDESRRLPDHDDLDCFDDIEAAGYIENMGTGLNPACKMTELGHEVAAKLRQHKANGNHFATFKINPKEETAECEGKSK